MKQLILTFLLAIISATNFAQNLPTAPSKIEFANVMVELDPTAQAAVNAEVTKLLSSNNKYLSDRLDRIQLYFPIIERVLEEENVPEDIKYVAVLESGLIPDAVSTSNAVGFWQFKELTGKEMGLKINNEVDERKHIELATKAAATYLKRNNLIYKNWISSILTFSLGANGASTFIPVDWSFASEIKMDEKTHPYLIRALANRIAYEYKINRIEDNTKKFIEYPSNGKSLSTIANELKVGTEQITPFNQWLKKEIIPSDKLYNVLVLTNLNEADNVAKNVNIETKEVGVGYPRLKRLTTTTTSNDDPVFYDINNKKGILAKNGIEMPQLAKKGKLSLKKILKYNDMRVSDIAKEGEIYYLEPKNKKGPIAFHTLGANQTLWVYPKCMVLNKKTY